MADQWKGKVTSIAGKAVAIVDVTITRTIMLDADAYEHLSHLLRVGEGEASGLSEVVDFYQLAQALPEESRRYVVVPWTDAEEKKVGLRPFADVVRFFEDRNYWRVEGSAASGFVGIMNLGAQDRRFDMSQGSLAAFDAMVEMEKKVLEQAHQRGEISDQHRDAVREVCDRMGSTSQECEQAYRDRALAIEAQRARDEAARKKHEKDARDREHQLQTKGEVRGDFPKDWGREFGGIA